MLVERGAPPISKPIGQYLGCPTRVLEQALLVQAERASHQRLGEILLARDVIDAPTLTAAVTRQRIDRLRECTLFASLSDGQLEQLAGVFREVTAPVGDEFIEQDAHEDSLYVLAAGSCMAFRRSAAGEEVMLSRLLPGEPVGEMGYFAGGARTASVKANETTQLLRASYGDLNDCFESVPGVASAFMEVVTRRLRQTNLLYQENHFAGVADDGLILGPINELLDLSKVEQLERSVDRLLVRTVQWASRLTDADRASLFLVDPETGELWSRVAEGRNVREIRVPSGSGIAGWVVEHNETVSVDDAYNDPRFNAEVDQRTGYRTHTMLCAPVRAGGHRVRGVLQVINKNSGGFTAEDAGLLRLLATQTALNLENIERSRLVVSDYRRMTALLEVSAALSQAPNLSSLSALLGGRLARILRAGRVEVLFLNRERTALWGLMGVGADVEELHYGTEEDLAAFCLSEGKMMNVPDVYEHEAFDAEHDRESGRHTRTALLAPVRNRTGAICGIIQALNKDDGSFTASDESLLRAIAAQTGVSGLLNR
ncbi:MAG: GAF domain-containing protein [Gammaproteobacteria bacterium]